MADKDDLQIGDLVKVNRKNGSGVAWVYLGPQVEPGEYERQCDECRGRGYIRAMAVTRNCEDCDATGIIYDPEPEDVETGMARLRMVGDDSTHIYDYSDFDKMPEEESENVCSCGQLGCGWG